MLCYCNKYNMYKHRLYTFIILYGIICSLNVLSYSLPIYVPINEYKTSYTFNSEYDSSIYYTIEHNNNKPLYWMFKTCELQRVMLKEPDNVITYMITTIKNISIYINVQHPQNDIYQCMLNTPDPTICVPDEDQHIVDCIINHKTKTSKLGPGIISVIVISTVITVIVLLSLIFCISRIYCSKHKYTSIL